MEQKLLACCTSGSPAPSLSLLIAAAAAPITIHPSRLTLSPLGQGPFCPSAAPPRLPLPVSTRNHSPPPCPLFAAHWVKAPSVLLLHHNGRGFELELDPTALPEGLHYAELQAFDAIAEWRGPLFRLPITGEGSGGDCGGCMRASLVPCPARGLNSHCVSCKRPVSPPCSVPSFHFFAPLLASHQAAGCGE